MREHGTRAKYVIENRTPQRGRSMSDTRSLAEELDYMGRRTTDPEASDLLIQAAQEVKQMEAALRSVTPEADELRELVTLYESLTEQDRSVEWTATKLPNGAWSVGPNHEMGHRAELDSWADDYAKFLAALVNAFPALRSAAEDREKLERVEGALGEAIGLAEEMLPYVPEYFAEKWGFPKSLDEIRSAESP